MIAMNLDHVSAALPGEKEKVKYWRDGRQLVILNKEDVDLAEIYLNEQEGDAHRRRIEAIKLFRQDAGLSVFQAGDIVWCAWERMSKR